MYKTQTTIELLQEAVTATTQGGHNAGTQTDPLLHGGGGVLFATKPFDQRRRRRRLSSEAGRYGDATEGGGSFAPDRRDAHPLLAGHATRRRTVANAGGRAHLSRRIAGRLPAHRQGERHPHRRR